MKFVGTKNFTLSELEKSETAEKYKINNSIPQEYKNNARRLLLFLQDLRDKWGSAIRINSGYRCPELNKILRGSKTSAHTTCNAVDLWPCNNKFEAFKIFMIAYLKDKNFDQCIIEKSGDIQWIHLGLYNNSEKQRKQIFKIEN